MNTIPVQTKLKNGLDFKTNLTYEVFGPDIGLAPIVLVNHALTGNSSVSGEKGWWNRLIGENLCIDTKKYTVLAFNIPGNGYDGVFIDNYKDFTIKIIADIFLKGLKNLQINQVHTVIGGSLGGAIAWQMAYDSPDLFKHVVPIAADFKTSDWVRAQCYLQDRILNSSHKPIENARINAMLVYRTPKSINTRFKNEWDTDKNIYKVEDWLNYHGNALEKRFKLSSYKLMNHLLSTISVADKASELQKIQSNIHIVSINSDLLFNAEWDKETFNTLKTFKENTFYHEIQSIHGHDAFLIEYDQLQNSLNPIFQNTTY